MWKLKIAEDGLWLRSMNNHVGRQHWEFDPDAGSPEERAAVERAREEFKRNKSRFDRKQSADLLMRMQMIAENPCGPVPAAATVMDKEELTEEAVTTTLRRAISFYSQLQAHDGHWPADNAGPLFFDPVMVMALYITGALNSVLPEEHQKEIKRYIYNHQNKDGGWGLHIEGSSTMFGSALNYIALRLIGEGPDDGEDGAMERGRNWILDHGGVVATPSWGKFWLALIGVYDWSGCNPVPPELCLFPKLFPFHPGKTLSAARLVYMPMSYLYGKRFVGTITGLVLSLRQELYAEPYGDVNWNKARNTFAKEDLYYPHPLVQDMLWGFLYHSTEPLLQQWPFSMLREKASRVAMDHVHYEDINSRYLCFGVVEKALGLIACWVENPNSEAYKLHLARIPDYCWLAEDGLKFQVTGGSQLWDAAFAARAIMSSSVSEEYGHVLRKAHDFIKCSQVRCDPSGNFRAMDRHISRGAWPFSVADSGWQVSDCTAEGLKTALLFSQMPEELVGERIESERLYDAVNVILSIQSDSGGFPAWEPRRAYSWLEKFNSTELFEGALIEREYVECTSSVVQALVLFKKLHPEHRRKEIESSISRAVGYIVQTQNPDGSWYGCWGICYTYGTWFAVEGLAACGKTIKNSSAMRLACEFLLSKQLPCGGWGESYLSSQNKVYTNLEGNRSNLVQTSWALLSLIAAGQAESDPDPIHRGIRVLINTQMEDGDFPQQEIVGVFMRNCTSNYSSYRNVFPIWALGEYLQHILSQ